MSKKLTSGNVALYSNQNPLESIVESKVTTTNQNEIILYQPNDTISIEVLLDNDTVWLTQAQIAELFERDRTVIGKHIKNCFIEGELEPEVVCAKFAHTTMHGAITNKTQSKELTLYNLDVIISVGYRVKSLRGTQFRQWANKVLKEYLLRGYAVNQRINQLEDKIDRRFADYDFKIKNLNEQVDFFVKTSLPPAEKVFFDGQLFDAHVLMSKLIESAENRIVLIDNYIDESVLVLLSKRKANVSAKVYTMQISRTFRQDIQSYNSQYAPIEVKQYTRAHDRFLIIDDKVYHVGASVKDLGKKLCAVSLLTCIDTEEMLNKIQ